MNGILNYVLSIVALILMGVFATFLVLLNKIKNEIERGYNDKTKDKDLR